MRVLRDWLLTPARAAVHLPTRTAVVADLHLGYGEARRRGGDAVPVTPVADALAPLRPALAAHGAGRLVVAGDLFEEGLSPALVKELLAWLARAGIELAAVVPGNHDRNLAQEPDLPLRANGVVLGGWLVTHGDGPRPAGKVVQGHEHPWLRWGNGLAAPSFLVAEDHLVLPAFSADAAGVNVLNDERWSSYRCCAIAGETVLDFGKFADVRPGRRTATKPSRRS